MALRNLEVKRYLSRLINGEYVFDESTIPPYPTLDVTKADTTTKTAGYTVTISELGVPTIFDNTGATGNVAFTLPKAGDAKGRVVRVNALAAQTTQFIPASGEAINYNGDNTADEKAQLAGTIGNYIEAFSDGSEWVVTQANGVVTKV